MVNSSLHRSQLVDILQLKVRKGKLEDAMDTLQKLRGSSYRGVEEEVLSMIQNYFTLDFLLTLFFVTYF